MTISSTGIVETALKIQNKRRKIQAIMIYVTKYENDVMENATLSTFIQFIILLRNFIIRCCLSPFAHMHSPYVLLDVFLIDTGKYIDITIKTASVHVNVLFN